MKQREIKFRMWGANAKRMYYDPVIVLSCLSQQQAHDTNSETPGAMRTNHAELHGMVWMQFTGLQDIQGKDIYERDAVRYRWRFTEGLRVGEVLFEERGFWAIDDHDKSIAAMLMNPNISDIEVIGNVFENPELLPTNTTEG